MGCYNDLYDGITALFNKGSQASMRSVETCLSWCQFNKYNIAGLVTKPSTSTGTTGGTKFNGTSCLCTNVLTPGTLYGPVAQINCNQICPGAMTENCGGYNAPSAFVRVYSYTRTTTSSTTSSATLPSTFTYTILTTTSIQSISSSTVGDTLVLFL